MSALIDSSIASFDLLSWAGHLIAVWLLGLTLDWLVSERWGCFGAGESFCYATGIQKAQLTRMFEFSSGLRLLFPLFLQLPRPKWAKRKSPFMLSPSGMWLGRLTVAWNGILLVREIWYRFCQPGTFRALLRSVWVSITTGEPFQWPSALADRSPNGPADSNGASVLADSLRWYVTTADLQTFKDVIEGGSGPAWQQMLHKEWDGCTYTAYRRSLPSGKTEYKSVTLSEDATAQEFMDFYLDDNIRPKWDGMITEHQLLESAHDQSHRCQVVRWLRSFPFAFISRREYVIARRVFPGEDPSTIYAISKTVDHPAAPPLPGYVRMSTFYSMWRSRTVPCPRGSGKPMCETTLLHFEDFGIPENLARFAVRHGMAGFVSKMVPVVKEFVAERRTRIGSYNPDPNAYGAGITPLMLSGSIPAAPSSGEATATAGTAAAELERSPSAPARLMRSSSVRGFGYMLLASGVALALSRTGSSPSLALPPSGKKGEHISESVGTHHPSLSHHGHKHHGKKRFGSRHHASSTRQHHHFALNSGAAAKHGHREAHRSSSLNGLRSHKVSQAEADA